MVRTVRLAIAAGAVFVLCSPALGAQVTATLGVRGGSLSMSPMPRGLPLAPLRKTGPDWRRTVRRVNVTVSDRRGTGSGWALTLTAAVRRPDGRIVRGARVSVWRVRVRCGGSCTRPRGAGMVPVKIDARSPSRIVAARSRSGMGTVRLRLDVVVTVPAGAPAGPYVLQPSLARTSGP